MNLDQSIQIRPAPEFRQLVSDLREALADAAAKAASPWRDRRGAAAYLQCSVTKIDELIAEGKLPRMFFEGRPRIAVRELDALITKQR